MSLQSNLVPYERCLKILDIKQEAFNIGTRINKWPSNPTISFENYSMQYRSNTETVLYDLTFQIQPYEKIGVVGRTGAGKSSMCLALCRVIESSSGRIKIDG